MLAALEPAVEETFDLGLGLEGLGEVGQGVSAAEALIQRPLFKARAYGDGVPAELLEAFVAALDIFAEALAFVHEHGPAQLVGQVRAMAPGKADRIGLVAVGFGFFPSQRLIISEYLHCYFLPVISM